MALTEDEIIAKLDEIINANRGEDMFVEVDFSVDFDAKTVLSYDDDDSGEWIVNQYTINEDGTIDLGAMPIMSFAAGTL